MTAREGAVPRVFSGCHPAPPIFFYLWALSISGTFKFSRRSTIGTDELHQQRSRTSTHRKNGCLTNEDGQEQARGQ